MKTIKYTGYAIAFIAFNQVLVLTPGISANLYYLFIGIAFLVGFYYRKDFSINPLMVWFLLVAAISLLVNVIPEFFNSPFRLITFAVVTGLVGPIVFTAGLNNLRRFIFKGLNNLIFVVGALSFLLYVTGISLGRNTGGFAGFFNHSMMMGPVAGIALIVGFYRFYSFGSPIFKTTRNKRWLTAIALVLLFIILLLSSSRAAILGASAGLLFFFYKVYQQRITRFLSVIFMLVMILLVTFPLWSDFTRGIANKQTAIQESGDLITARRDHWTARTAEFYSSPFFGIGFATVSTESNREDFDEKTGTIEPGSSWLAILSMVGVLGFIPVFWIFLRNMYFLTVNKSKTLKTAALGGLLVFFITHMFAEGYFLSSGSFLFFYVWLLLGIIDIFRRTGKVIII